MSQYSAGSRPATPRSDVDVAVHLTEDAEVDTLGLRLHLAGELEEAIGCGPVDVVVLDEATKRASPPCSSDSGAGPVRAGGPVIERTTQPGRLPGR